MHCRAPVRREAGVIDPDVTLAVNVVNAPGRYAILAGAGVSRSAQIPGGAEVLDDLIRQIAAKDGAIPGQPVAWYMDTFGKDPTYSGLLEGLASTAASRADLLRPFFEPTADDIVQGRKVPTAAHHAVARLAASGHISVIMTTNFDTLFEDALSAESVVSAVVRGHRDVSGMRPLGDGACTVIKIHGDYRDTATLNTPGELAAYKRPLADLLRQVFTQYGLLIVGWSADTDIALPAAMRAASRRYPWYYATRSSPRPSAQHLVNDCGMAVIQIDSADGLMAGLERSVHAIQRLHHHPLTSALAAESLKAMVLDPVQQVAATDLVEREYATVIGQMLELASLLGARAHNPTIEMFAERLREYDAASETLTHLGAVLGAWGGQGYHRIVGDVLRGLLRASSTNVSGLVEFNHLQRWPVFRFMYAVGAGAARRRNDAMFPVIWEAIDVDPEGIRRPLRAADVIDGNLAVQIQRTLGQRVNGYFALQAMVAESVHNAVRAVCPDDTDFREAIDLFEYVLTLLDVDEHREPGQFGLTRVFRWGSFVQRDLGWRQEGGVNHTKWWRRFRAEIQRPVDADEWPMLRAGAFDGDVKRLFAAQDTADMVMLKG
jgi:SIR2-like domain